MVWCSTALAAAIGDPTTDSSDPAEAKAYGSNQKPVNVPYPLPYPNPNLGGNDFNLTMTIQIFHLSSFIKGVLLLSEVLELPTMVLLRTTGKLSKPT